MASVFARALLRGTAALAGECPRAAGPCALGVPRLYHALAGRAVLDRCWGAGGASAARLEGQGALLPLGLPPSDTPSYARGMAKKGKGGKGGGKGKDAAAADDDVPPVEIDFSKATERMDAAVEKLAEEFAGLRTGRASPAMLESIKCHAYDDVMPLKSLGTVSVKSAQLLAVNLYDVTVAPAVEKAIGDSPLGVTPARDGDVILVAIPRPTDETRKMMTKLAAKAAEASRVSVRAARKDGMDQIKKAKSSISEDLAKQKEKELQKLHDDYIKEIDGSLKAKEKDISE